MLNSSTFKVKSTVYFQQYLHLYWTLLMGRLPCFLDRLFPELLVLQRIRICMSSFTGLHSPAPIQRARTTIDPSDLQPIDWSSTAT